MIKVLVFNIMFFSLSAWATMDATVFCAPSARVDSISNALRWTWLAKCCVRFSGELINEIYNSLTNTPITAFTAAYPSSAFSSVSCRRTRTSNTTTMPIATPTTSTVPDNTAVSFRCWNWPSGNIRLRHQIIMPNKLMHKKTVFNSCSRPSRWQKQVRRTPQAIGYIYL